MAASGRRPPLDPRLLAASRAARRFVAASVAIGAATAACLIAQALLVAAVVAAAFRGGGSLQQAVPDLAWLGLMAAAGALLAWLAEWSAQRAAARVKGELRARLAAHVLALGPARLGGQRRGELVLAATRGIDALDAYFSRYLPQLVLCALVPVAVLAWVAVTDPLSGLILALTLPLVPAFGILIGQAAADPARRQWRVLGRLAGQFADAVTGLPTLRLFGRSRAQSEQIAAVSERHRRATMGTLRVAFLAAFALETIAAVATALVALAIGLRLADGGMAFRAGLAVLVLVPQAYLPLRRASAQFHASAEGLAAADQFFGILAMPVPLPGPEPAPAAPGGPRGPAGPGGAPRLPATIRLEGVTVSYPGRSVPALQDLWLEVRPGDRVALTGPSGAGKSTVLALLLGFVQPDLGRVTAGGVCVAAADPGWREQVAWVPQRPALFRGTVAENLALARPGASREGMVAALAQAGAAQFVAALPQGLDTMLGEAGEGLSAGQRQRIALARAFLRDAPLVLLDEPSSALDPESEALLGQALERLGAGRTLVVVAHSPALARCCT
ncbi:MAG TPA: thiol reductant ABC exporter subunit CydD, partial [Acidimicrobiales bacterium]|nr:thiol reductant ABC exporter subunit CydD [Acidimicrobiales bacterium]